MDETGKTPKPRAFGSPEGRRNRARTEERMLATAQHLFAERGFNAVSVRDIAAEAGVSHALVHRYLGSKKDILTAVMQRHTGPVLGVARAATTVREAVPGMFRELRMSRPDYLKLLARIGMDGVPFEAVGPEFPAYVLLMGLLKADAAERGRELPDPRVLAAALTALVIGWSITEDWLLKASGLEDSDAQLVETSLDLILQSMIGGDPSPAASGAEPEEPSTISLP